MADRREDNPEELTETELQIMEGEEDLPLAYGPFSSFDGSYCVFCHAVGQVGAFLFGLLAAIYAASFGLSVVMSLLVVLPAVWGSLGLVVGWLGRFPVLGAWFGPPVERVLAVFDYYPTAHAREEYAPQAADGGWPDPYWPRASEQIETTEVAKLHNADTDRPGVLWSVDRDADGHVRSIHRYAKDMPAEYMRRADRVGVDRDHLGVGREEPTSFTDWDRVMASDGEEGRQ